MTRQAAQIFGMSLCLAVAAGCAPRWQPLFDGKSLDGWRQVGDAVWTVEDGTIVGKQDPQRRAGDLLTEKTYGDFELECTYKVIWPANTGIWFRYDDVKWGYQFDILEWPNPECYSGSIYCHGKMFIAMNTDKSLVDRDGWNRARLLVVGDHIVAELNGRRVADVRDGTFAHGRIGFQVHAGDEFKDMKVIVKDIRIRVLDKAAPQGG